MRLRRLGVIVFCLAAVSALSAPLVHAQTTLISDSFTGASGALTTHAPEINLPGNAWVASGSSGTPIGSGGRAAISDGSGSPTAFALINAATPDGTIAVDLSATTYAGMVFRWSAANAYFWASIYGDTVYLQRMTPSEQTMLAAATVGDVNPGTHHMEVRLAGAAIEVWWDGTRVIQQTDAFNCTATRFGLLWANHDVSTTYDNFRVTGQPFPTITRVAITPSSSAITLGSTQTLTAVAYDAADVVIPNISFAWTTSNAAAVPTSNVTATGATVTGYGQGSATITATPASGPAGSLTMAVNPGNVIVLDRFTGTNDALIVNHAPDVNQTPAAWVAGGSVGTPVLRSGRAAVSDPTANPSARVVIDGGTANATVETDWTPALAGGSAYGAVLFRWSAADAYFQAAFWNDSIYLQKMEPPANFTTIAVAAAANVYPGTHHLEVRLNGSAIEVWFDGVQKITATDAFNSTATKYGLLWATHDADSTYDNFKLTGTLTSPSVSRVEVTPATGTVPFGGTTGLTAHAFDAANNIVSSGVSFVWGSSNPAAVRLTSSAGGNATVSGYGMGSATITATAVGGPSGTAAIAVDLGDAIVFDRFTGADADPVAGHGPDVNRPGRDWVVIGQTLPRLISNRATIPPGTGFTVATFETFTSDVRIAADWTAGSSGVWGGLVARFIDADNYLRLNYDQGALSLWRRQGAVWTLLTSSTWPVSPATTHRLELRLAGSSIEGWADGVLQLQATDAFNVKATRHGVVWFAGVDPQATYDNFEVRGAMPPAVSTIVVTPSAQDMPFGSSQAFSAQGFDATGSPVNAGVFTWTASNAVVLAVPSQIGTGTVVSGTAPGSGNVVAVAPNGVVGFAAVTVNSNGILVHDGFTDEDGAFLVSHEPDINKTGEGWAVVGSLMPRTSSNRMVLSATASDIIKATIESFQSDLTVGVDWTAANSTWPYAALLVRYSNRNNHLSLVADQGGLAFWKRQDGNNVQLQPTAALPVTAGSSHRLQVVVNGSTLTAFVDGVQRLQVTETFNQYATRHGIAWYPVSSAGDSYDNFDLVEPRYESDLCSYRVLPSSISLDNSATSTIFTILTAGASCLWSAEVDAPWLTIDSTTGIGSGQRVLEATANAGTWGRVGHVTLGQQVVSVTQNGVGCQYTLSPDVELTNRGGWGVISIEAPTGCWWEARSDADWVSVFGAIGGANGGVTYFVEPNTTDDTRIAYVKIGNKRFKITQLADPCAHMILVPDSVRIQVAGDSGVFQVTNASCAWNAQADASWLHTNASGFGVSNATYSVDANSSPFDRWGTITVGPRKFVVVQAGTGAPPPTPPPPPGQYCNPPALRSPRPALGAPAPLPPLTPWPGSRPSRDQVLDIRANFDGARDSQGRAILDFYYTSLSVEDRTEWRQRKHQQGLTHVLICPNCDYPGYPVAKIDHRSNPSAFAGFATELLNDHLIPIVFLSSGDGGTGSLDVDTYFDGLLDALADVQEHVIVVPGFEVVGPSGGWSSAELSHALLKIREHLPNTIIGLHLQPERSSGASHPLEGNDPWNGDEIGFWWSNGGDQVDVLLYQTPHESKLLDPNGDGPDIGCWEDRWIEVLDRTGIGGIGWRQVPVSFFETGSYDYIRANADEDDLTRLATRAKQLCDAKGVVCTFGNGLPAGSVWTVPGPTPPTIPSPAGHVLYFGYWNDSVDADRLCEIQDHVNFSMLYHMEALYSKAESYGLSDFGQFGPNPVSAAFGWERLDQHPAAGNWTGLASTVGEWALEVRTANALAHPFITLAGDFLSIQNFSVPDSVDWVGVECFAGVEDCQAKVNVLKPMLAGYGRLWILLPGTTQYGDAAWLTSNAAAMYEWIQTEPMVIGLIGVTWQGDGTHAGIRDLSLVRATFRAIGRATTGRNEPILCGDPDPPTAVPPTQGPNNPHPPTPRPDPDPTPLPPVPTPSSNGTILYYHTDAIGSVRAITGQSQQLIAQYDYMPFGEPYGQTQTSQDSLRFAGKEQDKETTFDYFGARYYAQRTGRFTTVDPVVEMDQALVDPQRWNRYAYVRNNPLRHTDPDGRCIDACVAEGYAVYVIGAAAVATTVWLTSPDGQRAVRQVVNDIGMIITTAAGAIQSWFQSDAGEKSAAKPGTYRPDRTLPQDPRTGVPIGERNPDGTLAGEHTQIGKKTSGDPKVGDYTKGREFDASGRRVKDIDFTDHGRPKNHPNPHQHRYDPKTGKRLPAEELIPK